MTESTNGKPIFSTEWAEHWREELNGSVAFQNASVGWVGTLALSSNGDPPAREAVFVDLDSGRCLAARAASAEDLGTAQFVIGAEPATWRQLLSGALDPILALMSGHLALQRGSLAGLLPYALAAKELVAAATRVPTSFPEHWSQ